MSARANVYTVQRMLGRASATMTLVTYADLFGVDEYETSTSPRKASSCAGERLESLVSAYLVTDF